MDNFDLKKYLAEGKLHEQVYNAFDGNPEVKQTAAEMSDMITKLRKLGNEAYGGEKKDVYSSGAGEAFKAFDKAWSNLFNNLQSVDVKLSE
tara:strand:- start:424 stop:696 length:273 start_codon:yes stop_codon:yes gene_type:complete